MGGVDTKVTVDKEGTEDIDAAMHDTAHDVDPNKLCEHVYECICMHLCI